MEIFHFLSISEKPAYSNKWLYVPKQEKNNSPSTAIYVSVLQGKHNPDAVMVLLSGRSFGKKYSYDVVGTYKHTQTVSHGAY